MLPVIRQRRKRSGTRRPRAKPPDAGFARTRLKLEEARYFWQCMDVETRRMTQGEPHEWKIIGFLLSAFLSAAASVTNVMRAENPQLCRRVCQDFESRLTRDDFALLDWLDRLRDDEVHVTGAEVEQKMGTIPITMAVRPPGVGFFTEARVIPPFSFDAPAVPEVGVLVPQIKNPSGTTVDLIPECRRCLVLLEGLVVDAEREAAATPAPARASGPVSSSS